MKLLPLLLLVFLASCSIQKKIGQEADRKLFKTADINSAHIGISIYEPATKKSWYRHQSNKFFIPASNTKLFTCYAALKYLGDSLEAARYLENDTAIFLIPGGDPTLLHKNYKSQPLVSFLQSSEKNLYVTEENWKDNALGFGWSWDDYNSDYMAERSAFPVYGNTIHWVEERDTSKKADSEDFDNSIFIYSIPEVDWKVNFDTSTARSAFSVRRDRVANIFTITQGTEVKKEQDVPFVTNGIQSAIELLPDTLGKKIGAISRIPVGLFASEMKTIYSQPTDSMLRPMMHRSDNFFAEQTLMMVSQKLFGNMSDGLLIDAILKGDLIGLPQRPRWVDGSGLSRYNQFSPEDFVWLIDKMITEFGIERLKGILPSGGEGTLNNYFKEARGEFFAKTGTLSGHVALSGFMITKKKKLLLFSVLVNNHFASAVNIRRAVESFLLSIRNDY